MSWTAHLFCESCCHDIGEWDYTHNTNRMINIALASSGTARWLDLLDGRSGPEGADLLTQIVASLTADPERFRAMNPENGWGDFDSLVKVLTDMRDAVPESPTRWTVRG